MIILLLSVGLLGGSTVAPSPPLKWNPDNVPEELRHIPVGWLSGTWHSNIQEAYLVTDAYDLSGDLLPAFWHLFYLRLAEEYEYEMAYFQTFKEVTTPEEDLRRSIEFVDNMPIHPDRLCDMVESLLEQGDYSSERVRLAELRIRRDGLIWLEEDTQLLAASLRRRLKRHRLSRAGLTPGGNPMPTWVYARLQLKTAREAEEEQRAEDALAAAARRRAGRDPNGSAGHRLVAAAEHGVGENSGGTLTPALSLGGRGSQAATEMADPLIAAHEDATYQSWRAALRSCLARPGLSDADRRSARKLFDQWWSKAQALRQLRKADYEQIASLTSRKAHKERLLTLDKPLEGLFKEFSQRLAAIGPRPTRTTATSR